MKLLMIAGFLGSGKTTLLLSLLEALADAGHDRTVVIENEVNPRGVDDQYLAQQGLQVKQVRGGCICCTLRFDLMRTLLTVYEELDPELVILEPSGVADAGQVREAMFESGVPLESADLIVLIDSERYEAIRHISGPFFERGIAAADVVAINKLDLATPEKLADIEAWVRSVDSEVPLLAISARDGTNLDILLQLLPGTRPEPVAEHHEHHHHHSTEDGLPPETAVAQAATLTFQPAVDAAGITGAAIKAHAELAETLLDAGAASAGHLKTLLRDAAQGSLLVSTTTLGGPAGTTGGLSGAIASLEVWHNSIVFGVDSGLLEAAVTTFLSQLGGTITLRELPDDAER